MAKCTICGKIPSSGHQVSHSHHATKRKFRPNLVSVRALIGKQVKAVLVCAKCLKAGKVQKAT